MPKIELVIFDMAGTTVVDDNAVLQVFESTLSGAGIVVPAERINAVMGLPKKVAIRQLLDEFGCASSDAVVESLHKEFVERMKQHYVTAPGVSEIPGASEVFRQLRALGKRVALNTGFSRAIVDVLLHRLGWDVPGTVDAVAASDNAPRGRPHPDMIHFLMAKCGVTDAAGVAKIGDTSADLAEGQAACCGLNIGVLTGAATRELLEKHPHTHIVASVREVPALLVD